MDEAAGVGEYPHTAHHRLLIATTRLAGGCRNIVKGISKPQQMAFDYLLIPSMSAKPKRLFSSTKITVTDRRNRLGSDILKAI